MKSLTQILAERRKYWRDCRKQLRDLDTAVEKMDRLMKRIINRKKSFIDQNDYAKVNKIFKSEVLKEFNDFANQLAKNYIQ